MRLLRGRWERTPQSITWPTAAPPTDRPAEPRGWAGSPRLPPATMQRPLGASRGAGAGGRRLCAPGAGWPGGCRCREQEGHRRPERRSDPGDREWGPRGQAGECQQWNSPPPGLLGLNRSSLGPPGRPHRDRRPSPWHLLVLLQCPSPTFSPHSSYSLPAPGSPALFATPELQFVFFKFLSIL